ncbi:glycosyltransferase [Paenibacillus hamazuiensis]|uniref:glycosyltransferase n=1 Tax=Paenibacillus hamazuiensis TaxID=2936508 RepID=UPI00200E665F|nr:glycosyltransferase [Paenibacillus hamazuiensis]
MKVIHAFPYHGVTGVNRYVSILNECLLELVPDIEIVNIIFCSNKETVKHKKINHPRIRYRFIESQMGMNLNYDPMSDVVPNLVAADLFEQILLDEKPDLINFQHLSDIGVSLVGSAKELGISTIVTMHDYWAICPRSFLINSDLELCNGPNLGLRCVNCFNDSKNTRLEELTPFVDRYKYINDIIDKKSDLVITVSDALRNRFVEEGWKADKVVTIRTSLGEAIKEQDHKPECDPKDQITFGFIGNMFVHKGPHILIEAFQRLKTPKARLIMYGSIDPLYRSTLYGLADGNGNIEFRGSYQANELADIFNEIDVLVVPTVCPEQPLVILEALQHRTPVIASNLGGVPEMVNNDFGALFEAGHVEELQRLLQKVTEDPEIIRSWIDHMPRLPSVEHFILNVFEYYRRIVGRADSKYNVDKSHLELLGPQDKGFLRKPIIPKQIRRIENYLDTYREAQIAIFGTGQLGRHVGSYLMNRGMQIIHYIDNDSNKWGSDIDGITVISPNQISGVSGLSIILVVSDWETEILDQLKNIESSAIKIGFYSYSI